MLWCSHDIVEYLQLHTEFAVHNLEYLICMLLLDFCQSDFVRVICILAFSEADLIVLKNGVELLSHVTLEAIIIAGSDAFR